MVDDSFSLITKYRFPQYNHIIGIAHDTDDADYSSKDYTHRDASQWTSDDQQRAKEIIQEYTNHRIEGNIVMNNK